MTPRGVIVYLHGGGWVVGTLDDYATYAKSLAAATNCAVLLPDYRLAPEHPFPAGLEDTEDALRWTARGETGLPAGLPIVIAGDSAGANLATVAARRLRGEIPIRLQVLTYPVTACDFDNSRTAAHAPRHGMVLRALRA
jgi:acetyl esterase